MKWFLLFAFVAINGTGAFFALLPGLITYAAVPPKGISCRLCKEPEVQEALAHAAADGRATILRQLDTSANWILGLAIFNTVAFSLTLFSRGIKPTFQQDARREAPPTPPL